MKTMILDTSSSNLFISFLDNGKEIYKFQKQTINNHSEFFLDCLKEGLDQLSLQVKDFKEIIVGIGPGSYTGLRVALTVAKTFAWTLNIPLYTVNSLDILGSGYFNSDGIYAVMSTAKKNYYYYEIVEVVDGKLNLIKDSTFSSVEEFLEDIKKYPNIIQVFGEEWKYSGEIVYEKVTKTLVTDVHGLVPNYLRKGI